MATTLSQTTSGLNRIAITDTLGNVTGVQLANADFLKIGGGTNGQVLSTDGSGNLAWVASTGGVISLGTQAVETFTATAGQTSFTVAHTPSGNVALSINGVTVAATAATNLLAVVTYNQAVNGYTLKAGDRVTITYVYGSSSANALGGLSDVTLTAPATGQILTYNATTSRWVNTVGPTAFGNLTNGTSNVAVAASGNVTIGVDGNANIATFTSTGFVSNTNVTLSGPNVSLGNVANLHIAGGSNSQTLATDGTGNLSFVTPSKIVFNAYSTGSYTFPASYTAVTIKYDTKMYDPQTLYDTSTGRFQPKVAGWYQITAGADVYCSPTGESSVGIVHSSIGGIAQAGGFGIISGYAIGIAYFNGTTDYAYVQGACQVLGNRNQIRSRSTLTAIFLSI